MAQIHQLSETLSNQIAAGEVIERPASVVKELVENAIDAHADQIEIEVKDAGISAIKIADNGEGIESDQVALAFLPHTTSKITTTKDLFDVQTLGFRGEALASIAAIANVTLTTSVNGASGVQYKISGSKEKSKQTVAAAKGTTFLVTDLFYNTPARLKYVKTINTELNRTIDIVNRLALGHPDIAFTLINENRDLIRTSGNGNLQQAIAGIYGRKIAQKMVKVENSNPDFTVSGFVSLPELTRASRTYISLLVNGRYINNYRLTKAVIAGYGSKLMVGRYPIAVINIKMDPLLVDVNVHPTKKEVRLSKEDQLADLIKNGIYQQFQQLNLIPDALRNHKRSSFSSEQLNLTNPVPSSTYKIAEPKSTTILEPRMVKTGAINSTPIFDDQKHMSEWDQRVKQNVEETTKIDSSDDVETTNTIRTPFPELRFMTQIHYTYLIAESEDGFYLIDQHAAQERINYEKFRVDIGKVGTDQQKLLVPLVLDYPNSDAVTIRDHLDTIKSVGIDIEPFGQNSFTIQSHPTWMPQGKEKELITKIIDEILKDGKISIAKFREQTAITMSCKLAIKANHPLNRMQAQALLDKLRKTEDPYNCPHGRPVLVHFTDKDIQKMFKRIQDPHQSSYFK